MIIIRTDANVEIATGHIMRCITIAEEIVRKGEKVVFAVSDEKSGELAEKMGYKVICLDVDWRKPDFEKRCYAFYIGNGFRCRYLFCGDYS